MAYLERSYRPTSADHPPSYAPTMTSEDPASGAAKRASQPNQRTGRQIEIRDLRRDEIPEAVGVIARGMRDNPLHVAAYGDDPRRRLRCHHHLMLALLDTATTLEPICALRDGVILGVAGIAPPGTCQPTRRQRLSVLPRVAALGPTNARSVLSWTGTWSSRDLPQPHVHLGPVAVDSRLQGQGIGSTLLHEHIRRLDHAGQIGYLETDKPTNVDFYQRFGYRVTATAAVIGVPNWFMTRMPA